MQAQYDNLLIEVLEIPADEAPPARNCPTTPPRSTSLSQFDVINGARAVLNPNYVEVNETRLDFQNRNRVIQTVLDSVAVQPNYDALSKDLQKKLEQMYGPSWAAVVGTDLQYWTYFYVSNPYFINLKIDKLRVIAYKQMR